jgi:orotate phosphoribosyltransferase-like protein
MIDVSKLFKKYENLWVALTDDDKVIASGKTLDEVIEKARKKGISEPVTLKVPDSRLEFVY